MNNIIKYLTLTEGQIITYRNKEMRVCRIYSKFNVWVCYSDNYLMRTVPAYKLPFWKYVFNMDIINYKL
jgi:hypothetical protein